MTTKQRLAAGYERFSTDKQKVRSITDQRADVDNYAGQKNLAIYKHYHDEARTAATQRNRPGLAALKADAKAGKFQVLIIEAQDRLWGNQKDSWDLFERFTAWGVEIHSLSEGVLDVDKVTMGGYFAAKRLENIAEKTRRGHRGAGTRQSFFSVAFGYRRVELVAATADREAIFDAGKRERDPVTSKTVIRIYEETAAGRSPRLICEGLERDGLVSPNGTTKWNFSSLTGGSACGGIIGNELYKGVMVRNQTEQVKDPDSKSKNGKKKKMRPESEWTRTLVPELRIVSDELWEAANRAVKQRARGGPKRGRNPVPRREHALSGMLRCAVCNGHMRITNQSGPSKGPRFGCAAADAYGTCAHRQSFDGDQLLAVIRSGMRRHLLSREALAEYTKALHAQRAKNARHNRGEAATIAKRLADLTLELERAATQFLKTGGAIWEQMAEKLDLEKKHLEDRQGRIQAETNVVALHPTAAKAHEAAMRKLIDGDWDTLECRLAFRTFWSHFVVFPLKAKWLRGQPCPYEVDPVAREDALLGRVELFPKGRSIEEVVAAHGVPVSGTLNTSGTSGAHCPAGVVALGRWRGAA